MNSIIKLPAQLSDKDKTWINEVVNSGRNAVIVSIRHHLKARSGRTWSVTGGRGTAWGWIKIDAPPARQTMHNVKRPGTAGNPGDYDEVDTGAPDGFMRPDDRELLARVLGIDKAWRDGLNIPASSDYYRLWLCRAVFGHDGGFKAQPYWD